MRAAIGRRLETERARPEDDRRRWLAEWMEGPIALVPDEANRQHYEVPPEFFELILGPRLKYSSCLWSPGATLSQAEVAMLDRTIDQAGVEDGMRVLDLGCGWGSVSLRIAERFPEATVVAVSNSGPQGQFIRRRAADSGLDNVEHRVVDVNRLTDAGLAEDGLFDRVVSVEMLEHVRNHRRIFADIADLLTADGALHVHVFAHRTLFWPFEDRGEGDWMARTFFTGGVMPSHDLFERLGGPLTVDRRWWFPGHHYALTLDAWLGRLDSRVDEVTRVLQPVYGGDTERWVQRWRMFLMACSELFGFAGGSEWGVSHQLMRP